MRAIIVAAILGLAATPGVADVLENMDFSRDLSHWYTANGVDWNQHPQNPGTVNWSLSYDGSAKMVVSGTPGSVHLIQATHEMLTAADQLVIDVVTRGMYHATFIVEVGTDGHGGEYAQLVEPEDGEHQLVLSLEGAHRPGTMVKLVLVCWPGDDAACYVTNISHFRGDR